MRQLYIKLFSVCACVCMCDKEEKNSLDLFNVSKTSFIKTHIYELQIRQKTFNETNLALIYIKNTYI